MVVLPPTFTVSGKVVRSSVLAKLKRVSGVTACRFCLHPNTICGCRQVPSWSLPLTRQSPATVTMTMAHSHSSTSVSASTKHPSSQLTTPCVCCPGLWFNNLLSAWYIPFRTYDLPVPAPPCRQTSVCDCSLCICCCMI